MIVTVFIAYDLRDWVTVGSLVWFDGGSVCTSTLQAMTGKGYQCFFDMSNQWEDQHLNRNINTHTHPGCTYHKPSLNYHSPVALVRRSHVMWHEYWREEPSQVNWTLMLSLVGRMGPQQLERWMCVVNISVPGLVEFACVCLRVWSVLEIARYLVSENFSDH